LRRCGAPAPGVSPFGETPDDFDYLINPSSPTLSATTLHKLFLSQKKPNPINNLKLLAGHRRWSGTGVALALSAASRQQQSQVVTRDES
jgi:hypothetical protein